MTADLGSRIRSIKEELGERLLILGHHYQRSTVLAFSDERGDSLELARKAAANPTAERIVFCGVHFMAESADVLSGDGQHVYMPETLAGCPMANMATAEQMETAWRVLAEGGGGWLPVVYVNSSAAIKACCGRWGGSACTSSNAPQVFKWVLQQGKKVFFLPDEHLGVNTACDLGIPDSEVLVYDPRQPGGGMDPSDIKNAKVVVWKGFCIVHQAFSAPLMASIRAQLPGARIIVHPESPKEIVRMCDAHGSTAQIIRYVEAASPGDTIIIGTELNLVQRLAEEHGERGVTVKALAPSVCANMAKTNLGNLVELLETWPESRLIRVADDIAADARRCLETMLSL